MQALRKDNVYQGWIVFLLLVIKCFDRRKTWQSIGCSWLSVLTGAAVTLTDAAPARLQYLIQNTDTASFTIWN